MFLRARAALLSVHAGIRVGRERGWAARAYAWRRDVYGYHSRSSAWLRGDASFRLTTTRGVYRGLAGSGVAVIRPEDTKCLRRGSSEGEGHATLASSGSTVGRMQVLVQLFEVVPLAP